MTSNPSVRVDLTPGGDALLLTRTDGARDVLGVLHGMGYAVPARRHGGQRVLALKDAEGLLEGPPGLEWTPAARRAVATRARIRRVAPTVLPAMAAALDDPISEVRLAVSDSQLASLLDDHQARNVLAMTLPDGWGCCVFDEQGTGKTVTLIAAFDLLVERNLADAMVIVAPKSMVAEWAVEFDRFTGGLYKVAIAEGTPRARATALRSGADVVVMGYETLVGLEDEVVRLAQRCRLVLAVDESFNAKNPGAVRTQALLSVREHCTRAFALCGTPAPNRAGDLVSQFALVDLGLTFDGLELDKDRAVEADQIRERLTSTVYLRSLKSEVLSLPQRRTTEVPVTLGGRQRDTYEAVAADLLQDLRLVSDAQFDRERTSYLARRSMLLRLCSDPSPLLSDYDETPAKIAVLDELLPSLFDQGEKVLLWSFYRHSLTTLVDRFQQHGLVHVDGSVPSTERREAVRRFQSDPGVRLFVGNPAAAGAGLTLTAGRVAVYESMSNQAAHYMQSLDRIHRRGQQRDVEYYHLICKGTLEEVEYQRLLDKASGQGDLLGDPETEIPTRVALIQELLGGGS